MSKPGDFPDCDSCAFGDGSGEVVCADCENADQWEPLDDEDHASYGSSIGTRTIVKFKKKKPIMEAA